MDAAAAGEMEFRKEVRTQIQNGKGAELITMIEGMLERADEEDVKTMITELLKNVKQWVEHPDELEDGGRCYPFHPIWPPRCFPFYPYPYPCYPYYPSGGCYPPIPYYGGIGGAIIC
jgi:hypothetical protein